MESADIVVRFEKAEGPCLGSKVRNRSGSSFEDPRTAVGDFLARLWTLFGPPTEVSDDGYTYCLHDRATDLYFSAYSGASGPAYGGLFEDTLSLASVLDAFDEFLDSVELADCSLEYKDEFGRRRCGASNGVAYDVTIMDQEDNLAAKLEKAKTVLQGQSKDPLEYLNPLLELSAFWKGADDATRASFADDYWPTARLLWDHAFSAIENRVDEEEAKGARASLSEAELLTEVALEQLRDVAEAVDLRSYETRWRAIADAADRIRSRVQPAT